jgi:hypothetical protein
MLNIYMAIYLSIQDPMTVLQHNRIRRVIIDDYNKAYE